MTGPSRENIRVDCRVRPLDDGERAVWHVEDNSISRAGPSSKRAPDPYTLDAVYDGSSDNQAVFEGTAQGLVEQVVHGINATIFAYGQTASGKTHTMRGTAADPGVIPRALRTLFQLTSERTEREFLCRVSYLELYNECICDLLAPENTGLQIREAKNKQPFMAGLREEIVSSPEQALDLLELGERNRRYGETKMNKQSSRSHAIFRVVLESWPRGQGKKGAAVRVAVLNLADLAGSEQLGKTGAVGQRAMEGAAINSSLSQLALVILELSQGSSYIPYRNSKLTRILQPSLGGNSKTALICTVSPAVVHADETKSTLEFARRAKKVVNKAAVNEVADDSALLRRQAKEIEELRAQVAQLQAAGHQPSEQQVDGLVAQLRADLLRAEQANERMRQAKHDIQAQLQAMAGVLEGAEQDRGRLLVEREELENQAAWALEEKEEAEKEAEAVGEELREKQDELACLKGELPAKIVKEVKGRTRTLEAQLRQKERQLEKQERTIREQSKRIAELTAEVVDKDQNIATLRNRQAEVLAREQVPKRRLLAPQPPLGGAAPAAKKAKAGGSRAGGGGAENASLKNEAQRMRDMTSL